MSGLSEDRKRRLSQKGRDYPDTDFDKTVSFEGTLVKASTDAALFCDIEGTDYWIPRSQISPESEVQEREDEGTLVITEWIAEKKGLV